MGSCVHAGEKYHRMNLCTSERRASSSTHVSTVAPSAHKASASLLIIRGVRPVASATRK